MRQNLVPNELIAALLMYFVFVVSLRVQKWLKVHILLVLTLGQKLVEAENFPVEVLVLQHHVVILELELPAGHEDDAIQFLFFTQHNRVLH